MHWLTGTMILPELALSSVVDAAEGHMAVFQTEREAASVYFETVLYP